MSDATTDLTTLISPASILRKVRQGTEAAAVDARAHAAQLGDITCKSGCSNCCRQKVLSTPAEGLAIYMLLALQLRWTPELVARLHAEDEHATRTPHDAWFKERRPCVFLVDESCSVYPVRPPGCWQTFSVGGDPELCAGVGPPGTGQLQVNSLNIGSDAAKELLYFQFALDLKIPGSGFMTLPGAVLYAAAFLRREPPPRVFSVQMGKPPADLIAEFDRDGKTFMEKPRR